MAFLGLLWGILWCTIIAPCLYWLFTGKDPLDLIDEIYKLDD